MMKIIIKHIIFTIVFAAPCGPGSFYNLTMNECQYCPLSQYQNESGQTSCEPCPNAMITRKEGAISADVCKSMSSKFSSTLIINKD